MAKYASKTEFSEESRLGGLYREHESTKGKSLKNHAETGKPGCLILQRKFQRVCTNTTSTPAATPATATATATATPAPGAATAIATSYS